MTDYAFVKRMSEGLVVLHSEFGQQVFSSCKTRKSRDCAVCGTKIAKGSKVFRPITNGFNRMHRICAGCMESAR